MDLQRRQSPSSLLPLLKDHHHLNRPEQLLVHSLSKLGAGPQQHIVENVEDGAEGRLPWLPGPGSESTPGTPLGPGQAPEGCGIQRWRRRGPYWGRGGFGGSKSGGIQPVDRVLEDTDSLASRFS